MKQQEPKTVLFAPLNWGLGHAARIVPLIKKYLSDHWKVIWVAEGVAYRFLEAEFPELTHYKSEASILKYAKKDSLIKHLYQLLPKFLKNIRYDNRFVKEICQKHNISLIVSDNRYGFYHPKVKSVVLTHQVQLPLTTKNRLFGFVAQRIIYHWLNRFDECWIVDREDHAYAGKLSYPKGLKIPYHYIGLLTRMQKQDVTKDIDVLIVLSGLEPQRSILEHQLINLFEKSTERVVLVGGFSNQTQRSKKNIGFQNFANSAELNALINRSKLVVCRSGYSSIMDLIALEQKAILIPTGGQPEQVYLSDIHNNSRLFKSVKNVESLKELVEFTPTEDVP